MFVEIVLGHDIEFKIGSAPGQSERRIESKKIEIQLKHDGSSASSEAPKHCEYGFAEVSRGDSASKHFHKVIQLAAVVLRDERGKTGKDSCQRVDSQQGLRLPKIATQLHQNCKSRHLEQPYFGACQQGLDQNYRVPQPIQCQKEN